MDFGDITGELNRNVLAPITIQDRRGAKKAAYDEFRRRVVEPYEEYCIAKNGDIDLYEQADLLLMERYGEVKK